MENRFVFLVFFVLQSCCHETLSLPHATCSLKRYGVLTPFNKAQSGRFVEIPCAYRLADMQCGDYHMLVIGTNVVDGEGYNQFSPFVVHIYLRKSGEPLPYWRAETHRDWIENSLDGSNLWYMQPGTAFNNRISEVFDPNGPSVTVKVEDVGEIEFSASADDKKHGVSVRCKDVRSSQPFPSTLCGDLEGSVDFGELRREKDFNDKSQLFVWAILYQNIGHPCYHMANYYKACTNQALATRICAPMFTTKPLAKCYTGNNPWPYVHGSYEWFEKCLHAVCDNDGQKCSELKNKATECELDFDSLMATDYRWRVLEDFRTFVDSCPASE